MAHFRILKFRAWDKFDHEMYKNKDVKRMTFYSNPIVYDDGYVKLESVGQSAIGDHPIGDRHILMQYVGLKDKNGKMIFEGDVVKWSNRIYEIKWLDKSACFVMEETNGRLERIDIEFESEVIGNIYEDKNLLEETK